MCGRVRSGVRSGWVRAAEIGAKADRHRTHRLRGWRGTLGLAYLTLQAP
ncbi:hypothetical protein [Lentzea nigeriaca]|nr:hypothetical protein [Lentzea nigeriaca]MBM7860029.1 hypothetical protein [Lentzea nigeriaca]